MRRGALALALLGCGLPDPALEGEHVRVAADPGLELCGEGVRHMDEFIALTAAELGLPAPTGDDRIDFHWLYPADFKSRTICLNAGACAWKSNVYSIAAPHDHEVVHSIAWSHGLPPAFFIEGLAVAYDLPGPLGTGDPYIPVETSILDVVTGTDDIWVPADLYPLAGAFVGFLIERHGITAMMRVYERLRLADGNRRISRVFNDEFGESLEQAALAFDEIRGGCSMRSLRRKLFECAAPEIAWDGASWAEFRTLDCDQPDVVGPFDPSDGAVALYHTLAVPDDAAYEVTMIGDAGPGSAGWWNRATLMRCSSCEGYTEVDLHGAGETRLVDLPAGRYSLRRSGPAEQASGIGVRIERVAVLGAP